MPTFKLPLSGDVVQSINPFTAFMTGGQFGLINLNLGQSSEPAIEQDAHYDLARFVQKGWNAAVFQIAGPEECPPPRAIEKSATSII